MRRLDFIKIYDMNGTYIYPVNKVDGMPLVEISFCRNFTECYLVNEENQSNIAPTHPICMISLCVKEAKEGELKNASVQAYSTIIK